MKSFEEFLNHRPNELESSWEKVEEAWERYLRALHDHLRDNMSKYDSHHAKFGNLSSEHPDARLDKIVKHIQKEFQEMKTAISSLGAYQMV